MLRVIYQPKGRAGEYKDWAVNLYRGCGHGCLYCYGPDTLRITKEEFHGNPKPREDIISKLTKDCQQLRLQGESLQILVCFTCDPYQPINDHYQITRQAIQVLQFYGQKVTILTKGGKRSLFDLNLLRPGLDEYAVTLTCTDEAFSRKWEPNAAPPQERIGVLREAHNRGIYTWVSMEPVLYPEQSLELIRKTHPFVDEYKLGILNYHPHAAKINWPKYGITAIELVKSLGKKLYIKEDLRRKL